MDGYLIPLKTPCVYHDEEFISNSDATEAYNDLLKNTPWEKSPKINRWVTLMELPPPSDDDNDDNNDDDANNTAKKKTGYKYRDAPGASIIGQFPPTVQRLKSLAEEWYNSKQSNNTTTTDTNNNKEDKKQVEFNVCLLNYYENGQQRIGFHSDREELGRSTPIASISLGATRQFLIRSKTDGVNDRTSISMTNGSLIIMENKCQLDYLHSVPKEGNVTTGRINLTFRCKEVGSDNTLGELQHEKRDSWIHNISTEGGNVDSTASSWQVDNTGDIDGISKESNNQVFGNNVQFYNPVIHSEELISKSILYVVKTNIGAEVYCAAELEEVVDGTQYYMLARPFSIAAYVAICRRQSDEEEVDAKEEDKQQMEATLLQLRTAHHILKYHDHFDLNDVLTSLLLSKEAEEEEEEAAATEEGGEDEKTWRDRASTNNIASINGEMLYEYYKDRLVSKNASISTLAELKKGGTFRTSCDRIGSGHGFQAPELEREIGGAMTEYYTQVKPKMNDMDIQIRIDVISTKVVVGTQLNVDDLSKQRHFLRFRNAVTLKTNLAYAMIRLSNIKYGDLVVDPFCGSGTILLEALDVYKKQIKCVGMDVSRRSANGARENAVAEGFGDDICQFHCCDARNFRKKLEEDSVNAIVTNLPWGVMTGHKNVSDLQSMYEVFLRTAWYILKPKARIVMLVLRGLQLTRIVRKLSGRYKLISVNCVRTTNNLPSIVVVEKLETDEVRDAVKRQLSYLAQFVNVSSEMHKAVHYEKIDETTL